MQWYRHDHVELASSETLIVKRCAEPTCHETSQVNLTPVLKVVNDLANNTAAAVRGHCRIEVDCAMRAVGACERGRNGPLEGFGALLTEIFASSILAAAERAYRRVKKRRGRFEQFKLAKRDHISPRCALLPR